MFQVILLKLMKRVNFLKWCGIIVLEIHELSLYVPSIRTFNVSLSMLIVVKSTNTEKINVHIGSAIFQSGCNSEQYRFRLFYHEHKRYEYKEYTVRPC